MQNLEDENNRSAVEAASQSADKNQPAAPAPPTASPSVVSVTSTNRDEAKANETLTQTTAVSHDAAKPFETTQVHQVPVELSSSRLSSAPAGGTATSPLTPTGGSAASQAPASEAPGGSSPTIAIDDFVKVDLRVAQILVAERVPKADKLLRLEVDLGYEKRQILAGIAQYYEPEKLIGRKIVIVANLAPRKMRGLESNGMLLAASLPDGAPVLASFLEEAPLGARLK
jgi:methionyl-tRNA synthetase